MTPDSRSESIKRLAAQAGFARCGIAAAVPLTRGGFYREWLARGYAGTMGYLHRRQASRVDLRRWIPSAQSVIVVAMNYRQPTPRVKDDQPRGRVAMYAWGADYHVVLREKLTSLVDELRAAIDEPFETRICVDTSAIIEREWAAAAGVGWIGKNTMVLHESLGSYFFLGEIITDLTLTPDAPAADHCGTCARCLEACPTQAFVEPYVMDARRCISYLTIEHRAEIDPNLAEKMDGWVYGCDVCQQVCPHNNRAPLTDEPRFVGTADDAFPPLDRIAAMDEDTYLTYVHGKASDRARLDMWKRNAAIAASRHQNPCCARERSDSAEHPARQTPPETKP